MGVSCVQWNGKEHVCEVALGVRPFTVAACVMLALSILSALGFAVGTLRYADKASYSVFSARVMETSILPCDSSLLTAVPVIILSFRDPTCSPNGADGYPFSFAATDVIYQSPIRRNSALALANSSYVIGECVSVMTPPKRAEFFADALRAILGPSDLSDELCALFVSPTRGEFYSYFYIFIYFQFFDSFFDFFG